MAKKNNIAGAYTTGTSIIVTDIYSIYTGNVGVIERLSSAGEMIYYHVRFPKHLTTITFTQSQIVKDQSDVESTFKSNIG